MLIDSYKSSHAILAAFTPIPIINRTIVVLHDTLPVMLPQPYTTFIFLYHIPSFLFSSKIQILTLLMYWFQCNFLLGMHTKQC
jgi:hypothetical protein